MGEIKIIYYSHTLHREIINIVSSMEEKDHWLKYMTPRDRKTVRIYMKSAMVKTVKPRYGILQVYFNNNSNRIYEYLIENRSNKKLSPNQVFHIITGTHSYEQITLLHLNYYESIPSHVTKKLILREDKTALSVLLSQKGGN